MKFLLDQGVPRSAVEELAKFGHETIHVSQIGMSRSSDRQILEYALTQRAAVITCDSDFHTILALMALKGISVIRIRIEGLKGPQVARIAQQVVSTCKEDLFFGSAITVTKNKIRVRRLPLP